MSLSSSLFSGVSGLSNLGNSMNIIGDNIAKPKFLPGLFRIY